MDDRAAGERAEDGSDRTGSDAPRAAGPIEWFTVPGRLLLVGTIVGVGGLFAWYVLTLVDELPPGRYPVIFFLGPVAVGGVVFFVAAAFALERMGVRIYRRDRCAPGKPRPERSAAERRSG